MVKHSIGSKLFGMLRKKIKVSVFLIAVVAVTSIATSIRAGSSDIILCANKKTGALRYSKGGTCTKLESTLSINPNGAVGPVGPVGSVGTKGADGASGSDGSVGPQGPAGLSWKWVDLNGNQLGQFLDYSDSTFVYNDVIYGFNPSLSNDYSSNYANFMYTDTGCTIPLGTFFSRLGVQDVVYTAPGNDVNASPRIWWKATGVTGTLAGGVTFYRLVGYPGNCTSYTVKDAPTPDSYRGFSYQEVGVYSGSPPEYVAPVTVSRS